jgi:hypothetical protein
VTSASSEPWRPAVLRGLVAVNAATLILLAICWWGSSGEVRLSQQAAWINAAVLTLIFAGIANALGVAAGRRAITGRARELLAADYSRAMFETWERPS